VKVILVDVGGLIDENIFIFSDLDDLFLGSWIHIPRFPLEREDFTVVAFSPSLHAGNLSSIAHNSVCENLVLICFLVNYQRVLQPVEG
jgi:hypothetical protein